MSYLTEALVHGRKPSCVSKDPEERKLGKSLHRYTSDRHIDHSVFDKEIRELRPDWFINTADINKEKLRVLARSGEERPYGRLRAALHRYTTKRFNGCYDPVFDKEIRKLRPDWFITTADIKKEKLLELAKSGAKRPNQRPRGSEEGKLGKALTNYTRESNTYDPVFDKEIRELRPDWFENTAGINREKLFVLARSGAKRPRNSAKDDEEKTLGRALTNFTCKGRYHDPVFNREIRELRPDWFENTADIKKEKLLELARSGAKRPSKQTLLGPALCAYVRKGSDCYDPVFDKKIRKLRPDWFKIRYTNPNETADIRKERLFALARSGAERPRGRLRSALYKYATKGPNCTYDPVFSKKIRELRPDWFEKTIDIKKENLLELARSGAKKPSRESKDPEERKLGQFLYYTAGAHYKHPVFNETIRRLRPDWFINTADIRKENLLELARSGAKRPRRTKTSKLIDDRLDSAIRRYTSKCGACYDPVFDNEIRELRPDWL